MKDKMKILLGISKDDTDQDELLSLLLESAQERLKVLLGGEKIPAELEHIIVEAAVARFNRIGSEGAKSHIVEGENISFESDDFAGFSNVIQTYLDGVNGSPKKGGFRFL